VTEERAHRPQTEEQRLRILAELTSATTDCMREPDPARRRQRVAAVATQFGEAIGVSESALTDATKSAAQALSVDAGLLNFKPAQSALYSMLREWGRPQAEPAERQSTGDTLDPALADTTLVMPVPGTVGAAGSAPDSQAILTAGIQDITNTLVGTYELNDLLRMILETMYRGIGFTRVLLAYAIQHRTLCADVSASAEISIR